MLFIMVIHIVVVLDILEMICDWWSFSWRTGNLYEIFNWWNNHRDYMVLGLETRQKVEKMMDLLRWNIWNEVGDHDLPLDEEIKNLKGDEDGGNE